MNTREMFPNARRLQACPSCRGTALKAYVENVDRHYLIPGVFLTDRCADCGLVLMTPMPTADDLARLYPDDYYAYETPKRMSRAKRILRNILGPHKVTYIPQFSEPGLFLDIGCGSGEYMFVMEERGWKVYGSEINAAAAAAGRKAGLDIRPGEIMNAGFEADMFDFVRLNHAFEHIPNPNEVLPEIRRILKPGGKLFIGVPNYQGFYASLAKKYWWYFCLPVHIFNYSPESLRTILRNNGFEVEQVRFNSDYGSINGSFQLWLNRNRRPRVATGWALNIRGLRIIGHWLAKVPDAFGAGDCMEVIASKPEVATP